MCCWKKNQTTANISKTPKQSFNVFHHELIYIYIQDILYILSNVVVIKVSISGTIIYQKWNKNKLLFFGGYFILIKNNYILFFWNIEKVLHTCKEINFMLFNIIS